MATAVAALGGGAPPGGPAAADAAPLILITTVDIGDGNSDLIEVRQGDDPIDLARAFVQKHALPAAITEALAQHLRDNLREAGQQQRGGGAEADSVGGLGSARSHRGGGNLSARSDGSRANDADAAVFERLYHQAVELRQKIEEKKARLAFEEDAAVSSMRFQRTWISQEMMRERTSGPYGNYGEMLYAESVEGIARKTQKAERQRAQRAAAELQSATFSPEITRLAHQLRTRKEGAGVPAWERLSKVMKTKTAERMESLRKERSEAETRECTFRPVLCKRSDKLMAERTDTFRTLNVSAHQQLYQDSLRRQQKQEAYSHWFPEDVTFQPKLVAAQRPAGALGAGGAAGAGAGDSQAARFEHLYASYEKLQCKLSEARAKLESPVDPVTGRVLHKPQTGRGPSFTRHGPEQGVGQYLHGLQSERDEKAKQRIEDEVKRADECRATSVVASSAAMVRKLHRRRFGQVFEFMDKEGCGTLDMASVAEEPPECLEELDDDVRADLEVAARLACRGFTVASIKGPEGSRATTPRSIDPSEVPLDVFCALMEEAIAARPRPRAYLTPSAPQKYVPGDSFAPVIDERSKQLAAKLRPKDTPCHELLYREATNITAKKAALRAAALDAAMAQCTFAPKLVSEQIAPEGRIMRTVRQGVGAASQPLGTCRVAEAEAILASVGAAANGADAADAHLRAVSAGGASRADILVCHGPGADEVEEEEEEGTCASEFQGALSALRAQLDSANVAEESEEVEEEEDAESVVEDSEKQTDDEGDDASVAGADGQQFLELEREVEAMLEATNAAAAAAERLSSRSDQRYLSQILGLTQEAVDAMQPAMSSLPGWESRASRGGSAITTGECTAAPSAGPREATQLAPRHELLISAAVTEGVGAAAAAGVSTRASLFSVPCGEGGQYGGREDEEVEEDERREDPRGEGGSHVPDLIRFDSAQDGAAAARQQ